VRFPTIHSADISLTCFHSVEAIFEALSRCASLHPDPQESGDRWEDDDDAFVDESAFETFNGDEDQVLSEVGRVRSIPNKHRYAPYI